MISDEQRIGGGLLAGSNKRIEGDFYRESCKRPK
jgi:hypothetical protein